MPHVVKIEVGQEHAAQILTAQIRAIELGTDVEAARIGTREPRQLAQVCGLSAQDPLNGVHDVVEPPGGHSSSPTTTSAKHI
ncbi:hypothetical protein [Caulobacter sp. Root1472]|uniref:hypothetical protein n=1 Tax=Caulobacter sp. Root1472 TaxID=1736470 RepID=UPI000B2A75A4|nr:hypothetical protein [Caulobacter sp. Root1472]